MVVVHQGALPRPWCGEMVCQAWLLAVSLVAVAVVAAVDCMSVTLVHQQCSLSAKLHLVVLWLL